MTILAKIYAALLSVLALFAWYTDATLLHSQREHLAPDMFLAIASLPSSLSLGLFPNSTPSLLQLAWLTLCAAAQASIVFFFARLVSKSRQKR
jgi:hypothetical protein